MAAPPTAPTARRPAWRSAATLLLGAFLGAAGALIGLWAERIPANPHDAPAFVGKPLRAPGDSADSDDSFRCVTWNVHGFRGADGDPNPALAVQWLLASQFDVALLQEVPGPDAVSSEGPASATLGRFTGASAAFVGTERQYGREHVGNAVLSTLAAGPVHRIPLPDTRGKAFRTAVLTTVFVPTAVNPEGQAVRLLNVHLTREGWEPGQLERALDLFLALEAPCVLAGDFNAEIDAPPLQALLASDEVKDALAALDPREVRDALPVGKEKVDHIFTRGLIVREAAVLRTEASDHPLYWVDLSLPAPSAD
ncbi:endonuclease/exonuclease/phosphatase family protein [Alienimonas chondri]|uniref:Endonuclease/exonuclease/phosphatase domain-containing protein n=1 Tax=Alienimonas chondri TaxID=2681879 RepID=A0ABX1VAG8_9PLAN|nr:endonuclease/exonuclease/phosphatase family protein [Alienimonas chondri]NNJ24753.1 hypothetical protein [Alienimonas chondri]